jgi:flagellar biosynthetic protein FlhB
MTRQEVKDERKRDEGDPEIRGRQEQMRRAIARNRMMQAVPEADVVVSNPTHLAVALKWDEATMAAPTVVAKGRDHLAERIKQVARDNDVPVLERRDVARTLYQAVEVGMEIPPKLYYAVAEVLAFVLRKRKRR